MLTGTTLHAFKRMWHVWQQVYDMPQGVERDILAQSPGCFCTKDHVNSSGRDSCEPAWMAPKSWSTPPAVFCAWELRRLVNPDSHRVQRDNCMAGYGSELKQQIAHHCLLCNTKQVQGLTTQTS